MLFGATLVLTAMKVTSATAEFETIGLPPLQIDGQTARAHTQGLEVIGEQYYVTARLESVVPKRAILLRTEAHRTRWDIWDITPNSVADVKAHLDHPGGMQSDGKRLWIPVAESVPHGQSVIRVFAFEHLVSGQAAVSDFDFRIADHIGAIAVELRQKLVFGANWDTETVYVWNFEGHLQRTMNGLELKSRSLGSVRGPGGRAGVAVQDWKCVGDRFFASGLFRDPESPTAGARSRLLIFERFLDPAFDCRTINLPTGEHTELAQEAMAISAGFVHFIPEDLGASNRLFRTSLDGLLKER
jgi:hypothetical protein